MMVMALKPVYYLYGDEDYLMEELVSQIKAEALTGGFASMNYNAYEGKTVDASDAVAAASTMPAFSDRRVVIIKGAEALKKAQDGVFADYVKKPSETTTLIFVADTSKPDKTSELFKTASEKGYVKSMNRLSGGELAAWVKKEAKRQGKGITEGAARRLVELSAGRLRDIKGELDKIILFAGDKPEVDESDVAEAGIDLREESIFVLSDAIAARDIKKALKVYERVSGEDPLKVVGAIARQIRTILKVKVLLRKGTQAAKLASLLGIYPKYIDDYVKGSRRFTEQELKAALERLRRSDLQMKTGALPQGLIVPSLIMDLCGVAGARR